MALLLDPFDALASFQQALDAYRTSSWLDAGLSGGGAYPPLNVFRKGDDFIVIAELPGVRPRRPGEGPNHPVVRRKGGRLPGEGGAASPGAALSHEPELATRSPEVAAGVMQPSQLAMSGTPRRGGRGGCGER